MSKIMSQNTREWIESLTYVAHLNDDIQLKDLSFGPGMWGIAGITGDPFFWDMVGLPWSSYVQRDAVSDTMNLGFYYVKPFILTGGSKFWRQTLDEEYKFFMRLQLTDPTEAEPIVVDLPTHFVRWLGGQIWCSSKNQFIKCYMECDGWKQDHYV